MRNSGNSMQMFPIYFLLIADEPQHEFMVQLFETYYPVMKRMALSILYNKDDAEDVVQDAFLKLMGKVDLLKTFKESCVLDAYVVFTVRNKSFDYNKKYSREGTHKSSEDFDTVIEYAVCNESSETTAFQKMEYQKIGELFSQIPDKFRNVIVMKEIYGMTDKEIAQEVGISKNSVRTYIKRGRRALLNLVEKEAENNGK